MAISVKGTCAFVEARDWRATIPGVWSPTLITKGTVTEPWERRPVDPRRLSAQRPGRRIRRRARPSHREHRRLCGSNGRSPPGGWRGLRYQPIFFKIRLTVSQVLEVRSLPKRSSIQPMTFGVRVAVVSVTENNSRSVAPTNRNDGSSG